MTYSIVYYLNVSFSGLITSVGMKKLVFLLLNTRYFIVSVRRSFLFLLVLGIGCVILL